MLTELGIPFIEIPSDVRDIEERVSLVRSHVFARFALC